MNSAVCPERPCDRTFRISHDPSTRPVFPPTANHQSSSAELSTILEGVLKGCAFRCRQFNNTQINRLPSDSQLNLGFPGVCILPGEFITLIMAARNHRSACPTGK